MSLLRVISLTVLVDSIYNILIFFAEEMWVAFALQKLLTFFSKKFQHICISLDVNFNESLTNDIVSFEQLGPVFSGFVLYIQRILMSERFVQMMTIFYCLFHKTSFWSGTATYMV